MVGKNVYLVKQESNVDGEIFFHVVPCSTMKKAKKVLEEIKKSILNESYHFGKADIGDFEIEDDEKGTFWYINDPCDDYYEELKIEEKEIV